MSPVNQFKLAIVEWSGLAQDALHVYVALTVFLGSCLILGWRAWQWKPLLLVFAITLIGEYFDIQDSLNIEGRTYLWGNWHDVWNTMLAPTALFIAARTTNIFVKAKVGEVDEMTLGDEP